MTHIISAAAFLDQLKKGDPCCVLDVRTLPEYRDVRLQTTSVHIPLDQLSGEKVRHAVSDKPVYVLCKGGIRARKAAEILRQAGLDRVTVVDGGLDACIACGADVARAQSNAIPLERQVRMAAGAVVLLGFLLGVFVNPLFYALTGFVGAALIFSGLTGWCGMACLLIKAPWNR